VDEEHETVGIDRALTLTPSRRLPHDQHTPNINVDPTKRRGSEQLSPSSLSEHDRSGVSVARYKTPDHLRPLSAASNRSATPPLRRIDRSLSGDLRSASRLGEGKERDAKISPQQSAVPGPSTYDPFKDKGKARALDMADVYEGWGDAQGSPLSPTRPPSVRKRQSMQIMDLQSQVEQLASDNRALQDAKAKAEQEMEAAHYQRQVDTQVTTEAAEARDRQIREKDIEIAQMRDTLRNLEQEIARLTELNRNCTVLDMLCTIPVHCCSRLKLTHSIEQR